MFKCYLMMYDIYDVNFMNDIIDDDVCNASYYVNVNFMNVKC
jgi:hypothetical protein